MNRRVPMIAQWRGPETKLQQRRKAEKTAELSREQGWDKPLLKFPDKMRKKP